MLSKAEATISIGILSIAITNKRFLFDFKSLDTYSSSFDIDEYTTENYCLDSSTGNLRLIH